MLILQSGVPRSGNLWLYRILEELALHGGLERKSFIESHPYYAEARRWPNFQDQAGIDYLEIEPEGCFFRKGAERERIHDLDGYLGATTHVWTHSPWREGREEVFQRFDRVVYIIRDPRDVALSAAQFRFTPFMQEQHPTREPDPETYLRRRLAEQVLTWVHHVGGYLLKTQEFDIHLVFYERLSMAFDREVRSLADYLGIELGEDAIEGVRARLSFARMHTQNPDHVRRGQVGGWSEELSPSQQQRVFRIAGPMLSLLSYPAVDPTFERGLPSAPDPIDPQQVTSAVRRSRGGWVDQLSNAFSFLSTARPVHEKLILGLRYLLGTGRWSPPGPR